MSDQQFHFARELVRAGRSPSISAVVQQGLDLLEQKMNAEATDVSALRTILEERRTNQALSGDDMHEHLSSLAEEKRLQLEISPE